MPPNITTKNTKTTMLCLLGTKMGPRGQQSTKTNTITKVPVSFNLATVVYSSWARASATAVFFFLRAAATTACDETGHSKKLVCL